MEKPEDISQEIQQKISPPIYDPSCHDSSVLNILGAIEKGQPLTIIQSIISQENLPTDMIGKCFPVHRQWELVSAAITKNRDDILEMFLQKGITPDIACPSDRQHGGTTALQWAVKGGNVCMVKLLLKYKADVNGGTSTFVYTPDFFQRTRKREYRRTALYTAFMKDDLDMMNLLIGDYDRSCVKGGRCALFFACEAGAEKCAIELLNDPKYSKHVVLSEIPLELGLHGKGNLLHTLYKVGSKNEVYSRNDLGTCLIILAEQIGKEFYEPFNPPDPVGNIKVLLSLGVDVNYKVSSSFGYIRSNTPLEMILETEFTRTAFKNVLKYVSLLLLHGGTSLFTVVDHYLYHCMCLLLKHHCLNPIETIKQLNTYIFPMASLLYSEQHLNQIDGLTVKMTKVFKRDSRLIEAYRIFQSCLFVGFTYNQQPACDLVRQYIRLLILDQDITPINFQEIYLSCNYTHCGCFSFMAEIMLSVRPQWEYQLCLTIFINHIQERKDHALYLKPGFLSKQFPNVRPLKELVRLTIFNHLLFPRSKSVERLMLPRTLQNYLCLL